MVNIFFFDVKSITVPDSTLKKDLDRDGEFPYPFIIEFVDIIILICVAIEFKI